jgi:predicted HTH transcriptional regulator
VENGRMKSWTIKASELLKASLEPPRHELNELDWKVAISPDKKRLVEHLSAFSNHPGGGYLVFGVDNSGAPVGVDELEIEKIVNQLSNLGRAALEPAVALDHAIESYGFSRLLFVRIPESAVKPVHLRGKGLDEAFIRSGGTTRKASRQELGTLMLNSRTPRWEELRASVLLPDSDFLRKLNVEPILKILARPVPGSEEDTIGWLVGERFIVREPGGGGYVTNLGAIATARRLADFPDLSRKSVRVIVYDGMNKAKSKYEQEGIEGYAISFQGLVEFIMALLPQSEAIEKALRTKRTVYPEIAIREIVANALIHQDFTIAGAGPLIEIFDDRIEVSNPGGLLPSKQLNRIIGTQPESRNELLARAFRRYMICEERGSGLLKAGLEVELYGLPPIEFTTGPSFFKVTLYSPRPFAKMSARERLEACYQHALLRYYSGGAMTNTTLRERLKMPEKQRSMVSVLILAAIEQGLIKPADPASTSRKFAEYIPFWA